jgi:adenylosuccinate synthase
MKGWKSPTRAVESFDRLPAAARAYIDRLCALTGVKLGMLSLGPERKSTLRIAV